MLAEADGGILDISGVFYGDDSEFVGSFFVGKGEEIVLHLVIVQAGKVGEILRGLVGVPGDRAHGGEITGFQHGGLQFFHVYSGGGGGAAGAGAQGQGGAEAQQECEDSFHGVVLLNRRRRLLFQRSLLCRCWWGRRSYRRRHLGRPCPLFPNLPQRARGRGPRR